MMRIDDEMLLKNVTGGNVGLPSGKWVYGKVHGVVKFDSSACLALRNAPGGSVMYTDDGKPMGWQNGEVAMVNPGSRRGDWIQAQWNGVLGWTNANYVSYRG